MLRLGFSDGINVELHPPQSCGELLGNNARLQILIVQAKCVVAEGSQLDGATHCPGGVMTLYYDKSHLHLGERSRRAQCMVGNY
jgi:hypothetical protein